MIYMLCSSYCGCKFSCLRIPVVTIRLVQGVSMAACPCQAKPFMFLHVVILCFCISREYDVSTKSCLCLPDLNHLKMYYRGYDQLSTSFYPNSYRLKMYYRGYDQLSTSSYPNSYHLKMYFRGYDQLSTSSYPNSYRLKMYFRGYDQLSTSSYLNSYRLKMYFRGYDQLSTSPYSLPEQLYTVSRCCCLFACILYTANFNLTQSCFKTLF